MGLGCKNLHYWERLTKFRLYSNQRRIERYKICYIWKSLNGAVPNIGLNWQERDHSKLTYPRTFGSKGRARTLQKYSLNWEGVTFYNSLPKYLRTWNGTFQTFKNKLDQFLQLIPDQPQVNNDKPGGKTINGEWSNSIPDWIRVLNVCDDEIDDNKTTINDDKTTTSAECDDSTISNTYCASLKGSGLSLGHC